MNTSSLQLTQAPPISVPLRFFLTAPLFGLAAASLLAWPGAAVLASRWSPWLLAATHLLTLGFVTMTMAGALMQLLPVLVGTPVPRPRLVGWLVHSLLGAGTMALGYGFVSSSASGFVAALALLGTGLLLLIAIAGFNLLRSRFANATVQAMRLALAALAVTATLGTLLALSLAGISAIRSPQTWTDLHLAWGLVGWVALLVIGVAYQVVPMFQLTPSYPAALRRWLVPSVFGALSGWGAAFAIMRGAAAQLAVAFAVIVALGLAIFAVTTLRLQAQRRRRLPDVTLSFWQLAMASLLAAVTLWFASVAGLIDGARAEIALGVLTIVGFAISAVHGMLYKIVPFLVWLHLHNAVRGSIAGSQTGFHPAEAGRELQRKARDNIPNMKDILPDRHTVPHLWIHAAALLGSAAACVRPDPFVRPAAILLALSFGWLEWNLASAVRRYRRVLAANRAVTERAHVA